MAEFYLQAHTFLDSEWKEMMRNAETKTRHCIFLCTKDEKCIDLCNQTISELKSFAEKKKEIYVKKGVEYCKSECFDSKNLSSCSERCVKEYSILIEEFKDTLRNHYNSAKFYNN